MRCSACGGMFHPATGHCWTETCVLCLGCTKDFIRWIKAREAQYGRPWRRRGKRFDATFTDAALTSIKAK